MGLVVSPHGPLKSVGTGAFTWTGDSRLEPVVLGEVGTEPGERGQSVGGATEGQLHTAVGQAL